VLHDYLAGRLDGAKSGAINVDRLETEADQMRRSVNDLLYRGAFLPIFRSDIHDFVERMDMIADMAETTCDFLLGQRPEIPGEYGDSLRQILALTQDAYAALHDAVTTFFSSPDEKIIRERLTTVGITESTIDDVEWKLTRQIFTSNLSLANKIHLNQFIETLTEISDQIEDTGDRLEILHFGANL
jgi:predicted phosphate transport protein (TIGR00153 family)